MADWSQLELLSCGLRHNAIGKWSRVYKHQCGHNHLIGRGIEAVPLVAKVEWRGGVGGRAGSLSSHQSHSKDASTQTNTKRLGSPRECLGRHT